MTKEELYRLRKQSDLYFLKGPREVFVLPRSSRWTRKGVRVSRNYDSVVVAYNEERTVDRWLALIHRWDVVQCTKAQAKRHTKSLPRILYDLQVHDIRLPGFLRYANA